MTSESQDIASESRRRAEAVPAPRAEALERDLWVLLSRSDIALERKDDRTALELMALGVGQVIEDGRRDIRPDEEAVIRARMKEITE